MSLRECFPWMEPPAKRLCISQGPDLQLESAKNTECEESDSDCQQERTSSTSASTSSSKQSRRFRKVWLTGREHWLEFSRHDRGMFCSLCRKFNKRPFNNDIWNTSPCTRLRLQSIYLGMNVALHTRMQYNWQQLLQQTRMWCQS